LFHGGGYSFWILVQAGARFFLRSAKFVGHLDWDVLVELIIPINKTVHDMANKDCDRQATAHAEGNGVRSSGSLVSY